MKNLQSKQMPLRTNDRFYQSAFKEKSMESIKVFPEKLKDRKETLIAAKQASTSILKYLSELNDARHLPRKVGNKEQFYPVVKICRRHRAKNYSNYKIEQQLQNIEQEKQKSSKGLRFQTICSSNPLNRSILVHSFINDEQKKIDQQKQQFRRTRSHVKDQKSKQMRFSFYNTLEKSQFFLKKFKEDTFLSERRTNNFQNMFKRTITSENILNLLNRSRQKLKLGVLQ